MIKETQNVLVRMKYVYPSEYVLYVSMYVIAPNIN